MTQPKNRFGNRSCAYGEGFKQAGDERAKTVRSQLKALGIIFKKMQIKAAILLVECRDCGYWAEDYSTFANYVEQEVGIPMRTAQELMRVIRKCVAAKVTPHQIAELGWSKIALIAFDLTQENSVALLAKVKNKSYSQLQALLRQERKKKNACRGDSSSKTSLDKRSDVVLSGKVLEALQCASLHTRDTSAQTNLEFIAARFIEFCPPPSRIPENPNWN